MHSLYSSLPFPHLQVYKLGSDSYDSYDQHYGRGLVKDTIRDGELNLNQFCWCEVQALWVL